AIRAQIVAHCSRQKESRNPKRCSRFDDSPGAERAAHLIAELSLIAIKRDKLIAKELIGSIVERVPIEVWFRGAGGEVSSECFGLVSALCAESIQHTVEGRTQNQMFLHVVSFDDVSFARGT